MGKNQEERKPTIIVVKKRRTFSPPSLSEKTDIIAPAFTEQTAVPPRRNKFICRRNTYPRSASPEEEKEKTPFPTSRPLDQ